jgi:hypothetical protein
MDIEEGELPGSRPAAAAQQQQQQQGYLQYGGQYQQQDWQQQQYGQQQYGGQYGGQYGYPQVSWLCVALLHCCCRMLPQQALLTAADCPVSFRLVD